jgi:hypothetical protein
MADDLRFRLRLMRRRARLFSRQIAIATLLTAAALGLLASARFAVDRTPPQQEQASSALSDHTK